MAICPLSMVSGKPTACGQGCAYCPPSDVARIAREVSGIGVLLNTAPGDPWDVYGGLCELAQAVDASAHAPAPDV